MWEDSRYFWVVLCKNHWYHVRKNFLFRHRIPLAETDWFASRPPLDGSFRVRCDECRKEYVYKVSEVLRVEYEPTASFAPHPLFLDEGAGPEPDKTSGKTEENNKGKARGQSA
jgi:hypothetical protein